MSVAPGGLRSFAVADYVVFALMLLISAAIGLYYGCVSRGQGGSAEFLTGRRQLTALPVSMSLTASFMSSVTLLSIPAEVYRYGAIFGLVSIGYLFAVVITSEVFVPVYHRLPITSTYEYLELRFNRATRLLGTVLYIFQSVLFTGIVIYAPALALNQVSNMDLWTGIISTASICTLYCTLGGLKAVVWTDVFQIGVMLAGYLAIIIKSLIIQDGISTIIADSEKGGRLNIWDFDPNPLRRHTFWTLITGSVVGWTTSYGTQQAQVQRYIACKSVTHARVALYINLLGLWAILGSTVLAGLSLYSIYKNCDPWTAELVSAPDQLMPYLVTDIMTSHPGLLGLFFAAVYSGSLSTVSSSINALAAVTIEDLIKPHSHLSEKRLTILSKGLTVFYGGVCIAMAGLASYMGGMVQAVSIIASITGGPFLALFSLGILCPFANSKGGLSGLVLGFFVCLVLAIGGLIAPPPPEMSRPLPLTTAGCNFTAAYNSYNWTSTALPTTVSFTTAPAGQGGDVIGWMVENWHSPSYLYICVIGTITTTAVGLIVSLLTGGRRERVRPALMLHKEDTLSYHLFQCIKESIGSKRKTDDPLRDTQTQQEKYQQTYF